VASALIARRMRTSRIDVMASAVVWLRWHGWNQWDK